MQDLSINQQNTLNYKKLFEKMLNGFAYHKIILDTRGKPIDYVYIEVNKAFEEMTGLARKDILQKKVTKVLPGIENDTAQWIEKFGKVALEGKDVRFNAYSEVLEKWFDVYAFSPQSNYFAVIIEDITKQKKEDDLNILYKKLLDRTDDMITILSIGLHPKYIYLNKAHEKYLGYTTEELIDKNPMDYIHPDDRSKIFNLIKDNVMLAGKTFLQKKEFIETEKVTYRFKTKDGQYATIESTADMIDNKIFVVSRDVSSQLKYMEELMNEKERSETYFNIAGNILIVLDNDATILKINKSGCTLLNDKRENIIGKNWIREYLPEDEQKSINQVHKKTLLNDYSTRYYENKILAKGGEIKYVSWHNTVLKDKEGKVIGTLSSGVDTTEKRKNDIKIQKRTNELEKFNKLTMGRELKMIELKKENAMLKKKLEKASQTREGKNTM
jgi:PAS domain S-box-containing protein